MTTCLCPDLPLSFCAAASRDEFFSLKERRQIDQVMERRELPAIGTPGDSCTTNLYFGFFFDGTKNNYVLADRANNHSNVARLYDCYPGLSVPGVLPAASDWQNNPQQYTNLFKVYIPGVASPFKQVRDSGEGADLTRGAAAGYLGEVRIAWGLIQAINNVHRYFFKAPLVDPSDAESLVRWMNLDKAHRVRNRDLVAGRDPKAGGGNQPSRREAIRGQSEGDALALREKRKKAMSPPNAVGNFFDQYVHDSRAW